MILLAHGLGGRSDLPLPLWMAVTGAAVALLLSFFALGALWLQPRLTGAEAGRPLPGPLARFLDSPSTRSLARLAGILLLVVTLTTAVVGENNSTSNPAPTWFYVWFWVGLVPVSLLFGPVWKIMNPLRSFSAILRRFINGDDAHEQVRPLPAKMGLWPAAASLAAFVWLELVYDEADRPLVVASFITLYCLVHISAGFRYGDSWFGRGDGFEVYSSLLARLAPVGRRGDGRLVWRSPLNGLAALESNAAWVPVVVVILGSTAFDGITRTEIWSAWSSGTRGPGYLLLGTGGLAGAVGLIWLTYTWASTAGERFLRRDQPTPSLEGAFIHSLIPIAAGYTIAHYFSLLVFQGQAGYILASDPFIRGWNLFNTANWKTNYLAVSTSLVAYVQIFSIVAGHVLGVIAAHDRSVRLFPENASRRAQYSLLSIMIFYTMAGIALLVGS